MPDVEEKKYTFENVAQMLKEYKDLKRKALQLEFEISNYIPIATSEDMIDSMTFNNTLGDGINSIHNGQATDKTANIAIAYAEKVDKLNIKHLQELEDDLRAVNMEMLRLEVYINLLDEKYAKILRALYLEGMTFVDAAEKNQISTTALKKLRVAGIRKLVDMYNTIVHQKKPDSAIKVP